MSGRVLPRNPAHQETRILRGNIHGPSLQEQDFVRSMSIAVHLKVVIIHRVVAHESMRETDDWNVRPELTDHEHWSLLLNLRWAHGCPATKNQHERSSSHAKTFEFGFRKRRHLHSEIQELTAISSV